MKKRKIEKFMFFIFLKSDFFEGSRKFSSLNLQNGIFTKFLTLYVNSKCILLIKDYKRSYMLYKTGIEHKIMYI